MAATKTYSVAVRWDGQDAFIETRHCRTRKQAEREANILWQRYEQQYDRLYVIAWKSTEGAVKAHLLDMADTAVYFRCRPGQWLREDIMEHDD
jgi:hypothetical protein